LAAVYSVDLEVERQEIRGLIGPNGAGKSTFFHMNMNGGAIAIGHLVGANGARILMTLTYELRRRGGGIGACGICVGATNFKCVFFPENPTIPTTFAN
jgi:acetyl-CoA acetyltransferase